MGTKLEVHRHLSEMRKEYAKCIRFLRVAQTNVLPVICWIGLVEARFW